MRVLTDSRKSRSRRSEPTGGAEAVATVWLVFYALALGIAISTPVVSRAIEFAAR